MHTSQVKPTLSLTEIANLYNGACHDLNETITDIDYRNWAFKHHHREMDFDDGDLSERIHEFPLYALKLVLLDEININGYSHDEDLSDEFVGCFNEACAISAQPFSAMMPPLLHKKNAISFKYDVVDGIHRLHFLKKLGLKAVFCYVEPDEYFQEFDPESAGF